MAVARQEVGFQKGLLNLSSMDSKPVAVELDVGRVCFEALHENTKSRHNVAEEHLI